MGFSDHQVNALRRTLSQKFVHSREVQGRTLSYIEGWHAIAEANRIFGFDGWDRETVETKCLLNRETRGSHHAVYIAKIRITVRAEDREVVREGYGTGEAHGTSAGETHERALKTAETDATKRALATFGKPFGLSLYISSRQPREATFNPVKTPPIAEEDRRRTAQKLGANGRYQVTARPSVLLELSNAEAGEARESALAQGSARVIAPKENLAGKSETDGGLRAPFSMPFALSEQHERSKRSDEEPEAENVPDEDHAGAPPLQPSDESANTGESVAGDSPTKTELQQLLIDWPKRRREPGHLEYVRSQPCLICDRTPSDAHHLKFAQTSAIGRKVSDEFTVPLCRTHHRQLHQSGKEVDWWAAINPDVDPLHIARQLWEESQTKSSPR